MSRIIPLEMVHTIDEQSANLDGFPVGFGDSAMEMLKVILMYGYRMKLLNAYGEGDDEGH